MQRDAGLIDAAAHSVHRLTEKAFDRFLPQLKEQSAAGRLARGSQLYLVSLPIASLAHTLVHEYGHLVPLRRAGDSYRIDITRWPWPVPLTFAEIHTPVGHYGDLELISGGLEAAFVHESQAAAAIYSERDVHFFTWLPFIYAKLDTILYIQTDLAGADLEASPFNRNDPSAFVIEYELIRNFSDFVRNESRFNDGLSERANLLRKRSIFALADLTLASAVIRTLQYVWTGDRRASPLAIKIGGIGVVPSWHFILTPVGYEQRGAARLLFNRGKQLTVYGRNISSPLADHLNGAGASWSMPAGARFTISMEADLWTTRDAHGGYRGSVGVKRVAQGPGGVEIGANIGYKSDGYLEGYPLRKCVLFGIVGAVRF